MRRAITGVSCVFLAASALSAQRLVLPTAPNVPIHLSEARLDEAGSGTRAQLKRVTALLRDQQWEEAVGTLRQIMEQRGDEMIRLDHLVDDSNTPHVSVRDYCHWRLSSLADPEREALTLYRRRVDPVVSQWYEDAMRRRDASLLGRIVDLHFASTLGDDALYGLGEMALEQGDHTGARRHWERIAPSLRCPDSLSGWDARSGQPLWLALRGADWDGMGTQILASLQDPPASAAWLAYPDSDIPLVDVRARLVLVSILEGSPRRARVELDLLDRLHPGAKGLLGGRTVIYAEALEQLLRQSRTWPAFGASEDWTTWSRRPARNAVAPHTIDVAPEPLWTVELEALFGRRPSGIRGDTGQASRAFQGRSSESEPGPGNYFPVVAGDVLLVNDARRVFTVDIHTGQAQEMYPRGVQLPRVASRPTPRLGLPRFSMTVRNQRLLARMGSPVTAYLMHEELPLRPGYLLGWDLRTKKLLMQKIRPDAPHWAFDGTPLADESNFYVAMRYTDINPQAHVACFDMRTQRLRWRKKVCSANTLASGRAEEVTHNLLTLDHGIIYFNTNLGAVAAIQADNGTLRWVARYPRFRAGNTNPPRPDRVPRDPAPCLFHKGLLLVAPSDSDQVFALDANSGQTIWQTVLTDGDVDVVFLLGVVEDHLIASGRRLWWIDVTSGQLSRDVAENPLADVNAQAPAGRGVLAGDRLYWPARGQQDMVHVIDHQTGQPAGQPIPLDLSGDHGANLLVSQGYLFVTTSSRIYALHATSGHDK